jgi:hypothetical protein
VLGLDTYYSNNLAKRSVRSVAKKLGFRSGLEQIVFNQIEDMKIVPEYESFKISYVIPATNHTYLPDFKLPNGIIVETKGRFILQDRKKHLLIQKQYPNLDIRFVFSNSKVKISKGSKTTYADWCEKHGFKYADKLIPKSWFNEK